MEKLIDVPHADVLASVFGSMNSNISALEQQLSVSIEAASRIPIHLQILSEQGPHLSASIQYDRARPIPFLSEVR